MQLMKNKYLLLFLLIFTFCIISKPVYATYKLDKDLTNLDIEEKFDINNYKYRVSELNNTDIYFNNNKLDIYNFEVEVSLEDSDKTTWRKYVKLDDLCSNNNICEIISNNDDFELQREYRDSVIGNKVYYSTEYLYNNNEMESYLLIDKDTYIFNGFKDENSIFSTEGKLSFDVEPIKDSNDDLYVPLRFITEALGAEVVWTEKENDDDNEKVTINFYDDNEYCKIINSSYTESCEDIDEEKLEEIQKCDDNDDECLSNRCREYIKENIDDLDKSFKIITNYNYIDIKDNLKEFKSTVKKDETYIDDDSLYVILMYNGVPLPYDIFDESNDNCKDNYYEEKLECLKSGESWVTTESVIKLTENKKPFCATTIKVSDVSSK